jgi:hypothetical protein
MTSIGKLIQKWCNLSPVARVIIVTDTDSLQTAARISNSISNNCKIINLDETEGLPTELAALVESDLVIALFTTNTFVSRANWIFSPFNKPQGVKSKYAFIRLGISEKSLMEGLETPKDLVYSKINELHSYPPGSRLRVTSKAGTDITLGINGFTTCSHEITADGGMAFLPPSETSAEVITESANGKIIADITIGQLYYKAELLGYFGLVDKPVNLTIKNNLITEITGGHMAAELKEKLFLLPENCRYLVELGHGLSKMTPTGLIGVDESIIDTCHFGFGDSSVCGMHLDLVTGNPKIERD